MSSRSDQGCGGSLLGALLCLFHGQESLTISMASGDRVKHLEDDSREVALEAAQGLATTLALRLLAGQERSRRSMVTTFSMRKPGASSVSGTSRALSASANRLAISTFCLEIRPHPALKLAVSWVACDDAVVMVSPATSPRSISLAQESA
jgi:hypothetical protein